MKNNREIETKKWNWNAISSLGTLIASIAAISAIYFGKIQSNNALDRSDKQIELILQERQLRNEENRPLISINKNSVYNIKDFKQFRLTIKNIGSRPACDLSINNIVITYSVLNNTPILIDKSDFSISNPLNRNQEVEFCGNIHLAKTTIYYIRELITYSDPLTNKKYSDIFYFKWTNIRDNDFNSDALYGIDINRKQILEEQIVDLLRNK